VETSLSAEDALKRITVQHFDVIVCDYQMPPGMDSTGLIKVMKAQGIDISLIVFSGFAREDQAAESIKNGAAFYCQKSAQPEVQYAELKNLILHLHRLRHAEQEAAIAKKELESFSYCVSHDLRAPLRIIDGYCKILSDKYCANLPADASKHQGDYKKIVDGVNSTLDFVIAPVNEALRISLEYANYNFAARWMRICMYPGISSSSRMP